MMIFHVSDIEGALFPLQHVINFVNRESGDGDLVVVSGDMITGIDNGRLNKSLEELCKERDRITAEEFRAAVKAEFEDSYSKLKDILEKSKIPVLSVPGNHDYAFYEEIVKFEKHHPIHARMVEIGGVKIAGLGGADIEVSDPRHNITELNLMVNDPLMDKKSVKVSSAYDTLASLSGIPVILVTHMPPYGVKDFVNQDVSHVGSHGIRDYIDEHDVRLVLCGHIQESQGIEALSQGKTVVVNAGTLSNSALHKRLPRTLTVVEYDGGFKLGIVYQFTNLKNGILDVLTTYRHNGANLLVENKSNPKFT